MKGRPENAKHTKINFDEANGFLSSFKYNFFDVLAVQIEVRQLFQNLRFYFILFQAKLFRTVSVNKR